MLKRLFARAAAAPPAQPSPREPAASIFAIAATRVAEGAFWPATRLGNTLPMAMAASQGRLVPRIAFGNGAGLPRVYNAAIDALPDEAIAVCVHDDVALYDYHLAGRIDAALASFDVIGVAGNAAPEVDHVGWYYLRRPGGTLVAHQGADLSGAVNHVHPSGQQFFSFFGTAPRGVRLLDGLFLAFRVGTLRAAGVRFDERFDFHFYDLDLCRQCTDAGLRLGTWPIALGHEGAGAFETPAWESGLAAYRAKWPAR